MSMRQSLASTSAAVACIVAISTSPARSQDPQFTEWGSITLISAGWALDTMAIYHSSPRIANPNGCAVTNGGYATDPADSGRGLFHTIALSAFLNRKEVAILVQGCAFGKPRVLGINIR